MANVSFILNTIGGLISGTVVGVLALTKPNELPAAHLFRDGTSNTAKTIAAYIPVSFILVWIACGVAMVIWGFLKYPDAVPTLSAQAKGWLGSAAAALLAYITPPRRR